MLQGGHREGSLSLVVLMRSVCVGGGGEVYFGDLQEGQSTEGEGKAGQSIAKLVDQNHSSSREEQKGVTEALGSLEDP